MNQETADALIGQMAADAVLRDALLIALIEHAPQLQAPIQAKALVAALGARAQLTPPQLDHFDQRMAELQQLLGRA